MGARQSSSATQKWALKMRLRTLLLSHCTAKAYKSSNLHAELMLPRTYDEYAHATSAITHLARNSLASSSVYTLSRLSTRP